MCGIVGYVGPKNVVHVIIEGLRRLEYRGYDSAGIAVGSPDSALLELCRAPGKLANLEEALGEHPLHGTFGIGHTRWATHGRPTEENAHPHRDGSGTLVVVHNGIVENYLALKSELIAKGHKFVSETDTEIIAHLIENELNLAAAALLVPSAVDASRRTGVRTSKLLIPVAYGSLLGGVATYFTTANIIVSDLLTSANPPQKPLHILDFTPTGGIIALAGILFLALFGPRLLPDRDPKPEQTLVRRSAAELAKHYGLPERLWELRVLPNAIVTSYNVNSLGIAIAAIWRGDEAIFAPPTESPYTIVAECT